MKNFCEKQQQTVASDVWNLTFFTPFAGPTEAWIFVFLEVAPRLAFCRLLQPVFRFLLRLAAAFFLFLLVLFCFLLKIVFKIATLRTWFKVSVCNQNFTDTSSSSFIFSWPLQQTPTMIHIIYTPLYNKAQFRNLMQLRYEHLLQWQRNRSKATVWLLYEFSYS